VIDTYRDLHERAARERGEEVGDLVFTPRTETHR